MKSRAVVLGALAIVFAACDADTGSASTQEARIAVVVEVDAGGVAGEIVFGKPFVLRVERSWRAGSRPSAFDERALAPLVVAPISVEREERDGAVQEVRRFRAQAFMRGEVTVGPLRMLVAPVAGGAPAEHFCEPITQKVRSSLASEDDLAVEQPMELLRPEERTGWLAAAVAAIAFAVLGLLTRSLRASRRVRAAVPVAAVPAQPARDPRETALEAIAAIESRTADDIEFAAALATALREWAARRSRMRASTSTTEELVLALSAHAGPRVTEQFCVALSPCDLVKFARMRLGPDGRARSLAAARACVEAAS